MNEMMASMDVRPIIFAAALFAASGACAAFGASAYGFAALEKDFPEPGEDLKQATNASAPRTSDAVDNPFDKVPLESLTATRDRPLFSATRRPPPSAPIPEARPPPPVQAAAPAPAEPQGPPLALVGTITGTDRPVAVLFNKLTRVVATIREGDDMLGWRVTSLSARSATVEKDGATVTLNLPKPGDPSDPVLANAPNQ